MTKKTKGVRRRKSPHAPLSTHGRPRVAKKKKVSTQTPAPAAGKPAASRKTKKLASRNTPGRRLQGEALSAVASYGMKQMMHEMMKEHHTGRLGLGGRHMRSVLGIDMPFAFEWLTDCQRYPLGYINTIVGRYGCNKTSLKWEIARWFLQSQGWAMDFEVESKISFLGQCIIGYDNPNLSDRWGSKRCDSVEDWQDEVQDFFDRARTFQDPAKKTKDQFYSGRVFPVLAAIDSVMGKLSRESQEKIEEKGFADRGTSAHGYEANIITQFLKKIPHDIVEWPFSLLLINHLKDGPEKPGTFVKERKKAGGAQIDFQECLEIELANAGVGQPTINKFSRGGFEVGSKKIKMKCWKNSLGQDRREIRVDIIWWHEMVEGEDQPRFHMRWDWHSAAVDLLLGFSAERKAIINEVCHIVKQKEDRYHCAQLGVSKSSPVDKHDMGKLLAENTKVRQDLRNRLGIKPIRPFELGLCYKKQMDEQVGIFQKEMEDTLRRHPLDIVEELER